jgi:hypothetical protein
MPRLTCVIDRAALTAIMTGVTLDDRMTANFCYSFTSAFCIR